VVYDHGRTVAFGDSAAPPGAGTAETLALPPLARFPCLRDAIRGGGEPYVPAAAGIVATLVVERLSEAIRSGRPQRLEVPVEAARRGYEVT
jgi:hypothetical protein